MIENTQYYRFPISEYEEISKQFIQLEAWAEALAFVEDATYPIFDRDSENMTNPTKAGAYLFHLFYQDYIQLIQKMSDTIDHLPLEN